MKEFGTFVRHDLLNPQTLTGAVTYGLIAWAIAWIVARTLRLAVKEMLARADRTNADRTSVLFLTQLAQIVVYLLVLTFYAHLIPELRSVGTALLTRVSVAGIVVGIAAQNTLGNIVAGISLVLYRPFEVGDQVQVAAPSGPGNGRESHPRIHGPTNVRQSASRRAKQPDGDSSDCESDEP